MHKTQSDPGSLMRWISMVFLVISLSSLTLASDRILVADGALTETLYALGAEDRIVGVDTTSLYPAAATELPSVGYLRALSAEGIVSLNPDLLLATQDAGPPGVLEQIRKTGIEVELITIDYSASGTAAMIRRVGQTIGEPAPAAALANRMLAEVEQWRDRLPADTRVMFVLQSGSHGFMVSGADTRAHALITLSGATNPARVSRATGR